MRASPPAAASRASGADTASVCALLSQSGALFAGALRVNARKRHQGYVTLEGVTGDVLLDGLAAQNRAVRPCARANNATLWRFWTFEA